MFVVMCVILLATVDRAVMTYDGRDVCYSVGYSK